MFTTLKIVRPSDKVLNKALSPLGIEGYFKLRKARYPRDKPQSWI